MRLLLIRHAEPQANVAGIVAGPKGCTGLTDRGRGQAAALAERLGAEVRQVDFLYASILPRAVETAEIIGPAVGTSRVIQDCEFCEFHPGECDGLTWEDQVRLYGPGDSRSPDEPISPGGESLRGFDQRVRGALERLIQNHPQDSVALVCHGGFISAAMFALLGTPGLGGVNTFCLNPGYTSITEWTDGPNQRLTLERYNDVAHLARLPGTAR